MAGCNGEMGGQQHVVALEHAPNSPFISRLDSALIHNSEGTQNNSVQSNTFTLLRYTRRNMSHAQLALRTAALPSLRDEHPKTSH